jgi:hypothetical protein
MLFHKNKEMAKHFFFVAIVTLVLYLCIFCCCFILKVLTDDNKYLHLRIFQALPHTNAGPELASLQKDKTEEEIVAYFG